MPGETELGAHAGSKKKIEAKYGELLFADYMAILADMSSWETLEECVGCSGSSSLHQGGCLTPIGRAEAEGQAGAGIVFKEGCKLDFSFLDPFCLFLGTFP